MMLKIRMSTSFDRTQFLSALDALSAKEGVSDQALCKKAGIDPGYLSKFRKRNTQTLPKIATLEKLASALNVPVSALSGDNDYTSSAPGYDIFSPENTHDIAMLVQYFAAAAAEKYEAQNKLHELSDRKSKDDVWKQAGGMMQMALKYLESGGNISEIEPFLKAAIYRENSQS